VPLLRYQLVSSRNGSGIASLLHRAGGDDGRRFDELDAHPYVSVWRLDRGGDALTREHDLAHLPFLAKARAPGDRVDRRGREPCATGAFVVLGR